MSITVLKTYSISENKFYYTLKQILFITEYFYSKTNINYFKSYNITKLPLKKHFCDIKAEKKEVINLQTYLTKK